MNITMKSVSLFALATKKDPLCASDVARVDTYKFFITMREIIRHIN